MQVLVRDDFGEQPRKGNTQAKQRPPFRPRPPPPCTRPEIHVFDFDGTIFRSPVPSPRLTADPNLASIVTAPVFVPGGLGWFQSKRTLQPPCVPWRPEFTNAWYIESTCQEIVDSLHRGHHVVIMTGREHWFHERILDLLAIANLAPHAFFTKPTPKMGTVAAKVEIMLGQLDACKDDALYIVDDRREQLERMVAELKRARPNLQIRTRLVEGGERFLSEEAENSLVRALQVDADSFRARRPPRS